MAVSADTEGVFMQAKPALVSGIKMLFASFGLLKVVWNNISIPDFF